LLNLFSLFPTSLPLHRSLFALHPLGLLLRSIIKLIRSVWLLPFHYVPRHLASASAFPFLAALNQLGWRLKQLASLKHLNKPKAPPSIAALSRLSCAVVVVNAAAVVGCFVLLCSLAVIPK
jgi:hypothetical protein